MSLTALRIVTASAERFMVKNAYLTGRKISMFVIMSTYLKPMDQVDAFLKAHRAFLDAQYAKGVFLASGPKVPRTGGVILAKASSRDKLEEIMKEDPFSQNGISKYEFIEFAPGKVASGLEKLL